MKKVYVLVAAFAAVFGAMSIGSASFASSGDSVPGPGDTVIVTDSVPTSDSSTTSSTTTTEAPTSIASTSTTSTTAVPGPTAAPTTAAAAAEVTQSSNAVGQEAPTTVRSVGSDGLLPNTGGDVAIPLILAGLAAGTGAATLLVRRRSNVS